MIRWADPRYGIAVFGRELRRIVLPRRARTRDLICQQLRLDVRCDAQLALQGLGATPVLAKSFTSTSGVRIGADQRALSEFRERVEKNEPAAGLNCAVVLASRILLRAQSIQDVADRRERAVALCRQ